MQLSRPPSEIRSWKHAITVKHHDIEVAERVHHADNCLVNCWTDGGYFEVTGIPNWAEYEEERFREKRNPVSCFTKESQLRLAILLAKLNRKDGLPTFVTLTYPGEFSADWREWKRHLNRFTWKARLKYPKLTAIWKLEPQERQAPHFHALVWNVRYIPWEWLAVNWAYVIHGIDSRKKTTPKDFPIGFGKKGVAKFNRWLDLAELPEPVKESIRAGTAEARIRTWNGVSHYVDKYIAKPVGVSFEGSGRFWGMVGRKHAPWSHCESVCVDERVGVVIKRIVRRWLKSKGKAMNHHGKRVRILSNGLLTWVRLAEWACDNAKTRPSLIAPFTTARPDANI